MRTRLAHPGLFENTNLGKGPELALPLFLGLTMMADRNGCFKWRPLVIAGTIFPHRKTDINKLLLFLLDCRLIHRYEVSGDEFGYVINFLKYQKIHPHEAKTNIPVPTMSLECNDIVNHDRPAPLLFSSLTNKDLKKETVIPVGIRIGSHFVCTEEQRTALIAEDGEVEFLERVGTINDYCAAKKEKYHDYPAAYRNFRKRDRKSAANGFTPKKRLNDFERAELRDKADEEKRKRGEMV